MDTSDHRVAAGNVTVPAVIGAGVLAIGIVLIQEMVVLAIWFAIFTAVIGFGIGVLSIPILRWAGVGYMPPSLTPKFQQTRRFDTAWPLHVVGAAYYAYVAAFLAMIVTLGIPQWTPIATDSTVGGVLGGIGVGSLFVIGQVWTSSTRDYPIDRRLIGGWAVLGALLLIAGVSWDLFLPTADG